MRAYDAQHHQSFIHFKHFIFFLLKIICMQSESSVKLHIKNKKLLMLFVVDIIYNNAFAIRIVSLLYTNHLFYLNWCFTKQIWVPFFCFGECVVAIFKKNYTEYKIKKIERNWLNKTLNMDRKLLRLFEKKKNKSYRDNTFFFHFKRV